MDMRELLKKTVEQGNWINIRESGGSWTVTLDLKGGRKQTVLVSTFDEGGHAYAGSSRKSAPQRRSPASAPRWRCA